MILRHLSYVQGLLLHPYQTMQEVVEARAYFWIATSPALLWLFLKLFWTGLVVPIVRNVYVCSELSLACNLLEFGAIWITHFSIMWQILLGYLLLRFRLLFSE